MPRFYETTLSITNLHNLSISTHANRSRINDLISYPHALSVERHDAIEQGFVHVVDEQFVPTRGDE